MGLGSCVGLWADSLEPGRTLAAPFLTSRRRLMDLAGRPEGSALQ